MLVAPGLRTVSTPLGFGCSQLMGGISHRDSLALLETAFDAGIRHFDTAPSYGYGHAEGVLGEALRSKRSQVTITTKYGIQPPRNQSVLAIARGIALPLIRHMPSIKSRLSRAAGGLKGRARFSPDELRMSIDASLAALRTDYVDIFLLHEATVAELSDDLLEALERSVGEGKIRSFGVGSEAIAAARIYHADRRFCPVMQFEWSVLGTEKPAYPESFVITHRSLSGDFVQLRAWLGANPEAARKWSHELDLDVVSAPVLSGLMLAAARSANPDGITLFSSRNAHNVRSNARLMHDNSALAAGAAFAALVARDVPAAARRKLPKVEVETATG